MDARGNFTAAGLVSLSLLACGPGARTALAQSTTQTESSGVVQIQSYVYDGRRNDSYQTQISALLDDGTLLYDQTFYRDLLDPGTQAGLAAARSIRSVNSGGAPGVVVWSGPELIDSYEEFLDSFTEYSTSTEESVVTTIQTTSGDAPNNIIYTGDRGGCFDVGVSGATNIAPFDGQFANCDSNEETSVDAGTINTNTHTSTVVDTVERSFTNEDYLNVSHYQLKGQVVLIGTVHAAVLSTLFDGASGFIERMAVQSESGMDRRESLASPVSGDAKPEARSVRVWAGGHGSRTRNDGRGNVEGNERVVSGASAGVVFSPLNSWTFGTSLDWSEGDTDVSGDTERARSTLIQIGAHGAYRGSGWRASVESLYGAGKVASTHGDGELGGVSVAEYDASVVALAAQAECPIRLAAFHVTPALGLETVEVRADEFTERGGIALTADDDASTQTSAWLGMGLGRGWYWDGGRYLELNTQARLARILSGRERERSVAFANSSTTHLEVTGAAEERSSAGATLAMILGLGRRVSIFVAAGGRGNARAEAFRVVGGLRVSL